MARQGTKMASDAQAMRELRRILQGYGEDVYAAILAYIRGQISETALQVRFEVHAFDAHKAAHLLGQEVYDGTPVSGLATDRGRLLSVQEVSYFRGFIAALAARDARYYDDEAGWRHEQIARRVDMYLPKVEGSANYGFLAQAPLSAQITWRLGLADHCADCILLADASPWYRETLYTTPRAMDTVCMGGCKCTLEVDEKAAFDPAEVSILTGLGLAA